MDVISNSGSLNFNLGGDLPISRVGFGTLRLPANGFSGPARDPEVGHAILRRAIELGVNHIDTADFYRSSDGSVQANGLIRKALYPYAKNLVIATKVGPIFDSKGYTHGKAADMRRLVEANLSSLGLDCLDLVYLRIGDMQPPRGESLAKRFEALAALRDEGLIRHLGLSNIDEGHLAEAIAIAPVAAVQNSFHIAKRDDKNLLSICSAQGIAFAPFFPLGGGMSDVDSESVKRVAARHNATSSQIALSWLLALSPVMLVIPGTGSINHLEENTAAGSIVLTPQDLAELG